jgi:hypothetical protein
LVEDKEEKKGDQHVNVDHSNLKKVGDGITAKDLLIHTNINSTMTTHE